MQRIFSMELAGRTITAETGKYAEQAGGSVPTAQTAATTEEKKEE